MNVHPTYDGTLLDKYRMTYSDSARFIATYLYKRYNEDASAWVDRQKLCHNPAFARESIDEFARALIERSSEIKRIGGSTTYQRQISGLDGGIDRQGSTMNGFLAGNIIGELLAMGSVGIYVDNDPEVPLTAAEETKPYIYQYNAESILNWNYEGQRLTALLLASTEYELNDYGLPKGRVQVYRNYLLTPDGVMYKKTDAKQAVIEEFVLPLSHIPFVRITLPHSLLRDTCEYQITLLNLRSAAVYQAWASNFPLFTEQSDPHSDLLKRASEPEKKVGTMTGIKYSTGTERPGWINPSPDPLRVSMEQQDQLKQEIRQLTALAITNMVPKMASADSKAEDRAGLEAGLSAIGQLLEAAETQVSNFYHAYKKTQPAEIQYPKRYELLDEAERRANAKELTDLQHAVPSRTFQRETAKVIASVLHGHRVPFDTLTKMHTEIEASPVPTSDPDVLRSDHEAGLVSDKTASIGRGYADDEAEKAREDHALRIARIQAAQSPEGARGLKDLDTNPGNAGVVEKTLTQSVHKTDNGDKPVRGEGK